MMPEYCPNCECEIVRGAQIYVCEVCGRECCTNCTESTKEFTVICEDCEAARRGQFTISRRTQSVSYKCARRRARRIAAGLPVKPRKVQPKPVDPAGAAKWASVFRERIE